MHPFVRDHRNFGVKAPIVEALIDIALPAPVALELLDALADELGETFPHRQQLVQWDLELSGGRGATVAPQVSRGFLLHTPARDAALQLRRDGFSMSHLAPYRRWDVLVDDLRTWWPRYAQAAGVVGISRLATRFINRFEFPAGEPLSHWLRLLPPTPPALSRPADEFYVRTVHRHPTLDAHAIVQLVQQNHVGGEPLTVILDIECLRTNTEISADGEDLWRSLDQLRAFKNDIFFSSITDHTEAWLS